MLRVLAIIALVAVLGAAVFGSAAALSVEGGILQAGIDGNLACTSAGVYVPAWGLNTLAGADEGVEYVWINSVADQDAFIAACNGAKIFARVKAGENYLYSSGTMTGHAWVTIGEDTPNAEYGWKLYLIYPQSSAGTVQYPNAEDVTEIKVWLEGGPVS